MKAPNPEEIPRSIIKGSGFVNADFGSLGDKGKLLLLDTRCVVVGLGDIPHTVFATPQFSDVELPLKFSENIFEVKNFVFQATFSSELRMKNQFCKIPEWLINFKNIESLILDLVELDDLAFLKDLPIQYLTFQNAKINDENRLIDAIKQLKQLKGITVNNKFSANLIQLIEVELPELVLTYVSEE
ncbi:MAG: hypothetical protein JWN56_2501 [Sphingobacteriales bacterium]|nr:hypothetical protein [Sphingobacteriales bacterium]